MAERYMRQAAQVALDATCERRLCGSVIVAQGEIIGRGFNSPAQNLESQRRCDVSKNLYHRKVTDKTCCVHAEQRAILDALRHHPDKVVGSRLYFVSIDESGDTLRSGQPYCTLCSKLTLEVGIAEFALWHKEGVGVYDTAAYNDLSYEFCDIR